jgi:hypothetical protein
MEECSSSNSTELTDEEKLQILQREFERMSELLVNQESTIVHLKEQLEVAELEVGSLKAKVVAAGCENQALHSTLFETSELMNLLIVESRIMGNIIYDDFYPGEPIARPGFVE